MPCFLKLLCIGLKKDPNFSDGARIGIERVFKYYILHVNERLSKQFNYDFLRLNLVKKVIDRFAAVMVGNVSESLIYEDGFLLVEDTVSKFLERRRYLDELLHENIFVDSVTRSAGDEIQFYVRFAYQRLGDHMMARHLLNNESDDYRRAFESGGSIAVFLNRFNSTRSQQGILEAIAIQLPGYSGEELFDVLPEAQRLEPRFLHPILQSLAWRPVNVAPELLDFLLGELVGNERQQISLHLFWDINIGLSLDETNTFNGNYLHQTLFRLSLSARDAIWTIYLQDRYPNNDYEINPVDRLLKWAWKSGPADEYPPEVVLLGSKTIAWFFTSVNRGLRDVSTKALIFLFGNHQSLIIEWMTAFEGVNDPYVTQRVYAVAAGCAFRTTNNDVLKVIADYVYQTTFDAGEASPDLLLRDYARLIVELAFYRKIGEHFDIAKARPPFHSTFPEIFPTDEETDRYKPNIEGTKQQYLLSKRAILASMVTEYGRGTAGYGDFGRYTFESALRDWQGIDANLLSNLAVKWVFEKYGYDVEKFGAFDRSPGGSSDRIRKIHKERIGKKYQWMAFHEILARVADNKSFSDGSKFKGAWEPFVRDIDPTFVANPYLEKEPFWLPKFEYSHWSKSKTKWLRDNTDIPEPGAMINVDDTDHQEWLILEMYPEWGDRDEQDPDVSFGREQRRLWLQLRSYITKSGDYNQITLALDNTSLMGRWMPESRNFYELYNREYYWSPANADLIAPAKLWQPIKHERRLIGKVALTSIEYLWESEFDNSKPNGAVHILKPSPFLYHLLGIKDGPQDGEFVDELGNVVCLDPSVNYDAPSCLLVKKELLLEKLKKRRLNIFWTILGEKQVLNTDDPSVVISAVIRHSKYGTSGEYHFFDR